MAGRLNYNQREVAYVYSLLLVDDEYPDLEGMKRFVPWETFGLELADAVNNAFEALAILEKRRIDILITDISMPIMSGLELAQKALARHPELKVIFISGYQDFHYARQAISLDASGYVLKPVDDRELKNVLRKTIAQLDEDRERQRKESRLSESLPLAREELLHRWLEGKRDPGTLSLLAEEFRSELAGGYLCAAVMEIDDTAWKLNQHSEAERSRILDAAEKRVNEELGRLLPAAFCRIEQHRYACLLRSEEEVARLAGFPDAFARESPLSVTVGLGVPCGSPEELPRSFEQAKEALNHKMFSGKSRLIRYAESRIELSENARDLEEILGTLFTAMTKYELVKCDDCIEDLFQSAARLGDKLSVYPFFLHIVSRLDRFLANLNEDLFGMMQWDWENVNVLFRLETLDDIKSWLRRVVFQLSEMLHRKKNNKNARLIQEIERYVDEHIEEHVSIRDLVQTFAFSPNYLRHLYKKETGENISDYIQRKRLERAAELLQDPKIKVYEVAERLQYSTITLFNRQFRDTYGMSPSDYRKRSGGKE